MADMCCSCAVRALQEGAAEGAASTPQISYIQGDEEMLPLRRHSLDCKSLHNTPASWITHVWRIVFSITIVALVLQSLMLVCSAVIITCLGLHWVNDLPVRHWLPGLNCLILHSVAMSSIFLATRIDIAAWL